MCRCGVLISSVFVIVSNVLLVTSFNIDTFNYVQHKGQNRSMFGFSVATHKEQGRSWVIVGAPEAQSELNTGIVRGGSVYKCITTSDNGCDEIIFNDERSERDKKPIDDKDFQWFGATVSSAGPDLPIVACAPRYVWFTKSREERRDPVGTCYITKNNFRDSSEYSPCRTSLFGYHRQGSCQAGLSAGMSKDGTRLFIGAPGSWYWQGQSYSIDPQVNFPFHPGIFGEAFGFNARPKGQVFQQSLNKRPAVFSTPEGPARDDDSYMGYSMVVGDFNNVGTQGVAVGMPKGGESLEGRILLYTWDLTNYLNISGTQLGAYYGYALANSDVDGDGRDDLLIGAPLHTEKNTENKYEVGRVEIACQGPSGSFSRRIILDGFKSKSRFGLALSTLGDMNLDGYGDFAVGAPYDGPFERGAVYIFQGAPNGAVTKYSQVIYAENVQRSYVGREPVNTFGFSISGGLDLDGNDYPDMAIGAYSSDVAYFFRARPVVKVEAYVKFLTPHKQLFLEQKDCYKPNNPNIRVTCTDIEVCVRYTGVGVPSRIDLNIEHILDAKKLKQQTRMYLGRASGQSVNTTLILYKDTEFNCNLKDKIYLEEQIIDKLTELMVEVKYSLKSSEALSQTVRNPTSILVPILDESKPTSVNDSISIYKNCGPDNICYPDLRLHVNQQIDGYVYELGKSLEFIVEVTNHAEDAYNAKFFLHLPPGIGFKVAKRTDYPESKVSCSTSFNASVFVCDIGNPLSKVFNFKLEVEPLRYHKLLSPSYDFLMNVTSANPEYNHTMQDNVVQFSIKIIVNAELSLEGKSVPSTVYYNLNQYPSEAKVWDSEIGPSVIHSYTVTNAGPSDVQNVEIFIIWPHLAAQGKDLLYLLEEPHTLGNVQCEIVGANYNGYTLAGQREVWEILEITPEYLHHNATPHVQHNKTVIISGQAGNTITTTETELIFFDELNKVIHREKLIREPSYEEYWQQVAKFVNSHPGPLVVAVNTTIHVKYENGTVISHPSNRPGIPEIPYGSYRVRSNTTTLVAYSDSLGNILYEEIISEEPGSESFTKRVRSTTDRYTFPLSIRTNTTRETSYVTSDGKVLYQEFVSKVGTGESTSVETSKISTIINVVLYDANGNKLEAHTVTAEPGTEAYWEQINALVGKYPDPVTIRIFKGKITTYYINGVEIRKEEVSGSSTTLEAPFRSYIDVITTITCFGVDGQVLDQGSIPGESGTTEYQKIVNKMVKQYKQPITIKTNTTTAVTYRGSAGKIIHTGYMYKEKIDKYHQDLLQNAVTTTKITIYDSYGKEIHHENIKQEPGTPAYWEELNKIVSKYKVPGTIGTQHVKTITYYVNGKPTDVEVTSGTVEKKFISHTDTTTVTIRDMNGNQLYQTAIPSDSDSKQYRELISRLTLQFPQPLIIKTNTTRFITYRTENGQILQNGYVYSEKTEHYNQSQPETVTTIVTTVTVHDSHGRPVGTEIVTENPGTQAYWETINQIISKHKPPVTVSTTHIKTIKYILNGKEVNHENVPFTTRTETTTSISCRNAQDGATLYSSQLPGDSNSAAYKDLISTLTSTYTQPIIITTNVTRITHYLDTLGNEILTNTAFEAKTQSYNQHSGETFKITTATVLTIYGMNGLQLHQEVITEEPESREYWNRVNQIIATYTQPVTVKTSTTQRVTYYLNGIEIKTEEKPLHPGVNEVPLTVNTNVVTSVTCKDANNAVIHQVSLPGDSSTTAYRDVINGVKAQYRQPMTIITNVTKTITYRDSRGQPVSTGFVTEVKQEHFAPATLETSRTSTVTTVSVYDVNNRLVTQESLPYEPGTREYWEAFTKIIGHHATPVTVRIATSSVTTYYINGIETRRDDKPYVGDASRIPASIRIESTSTIVCHDRNGKQLYTITIPGDTQTTEYRNAISTIKNTYHQPIAVKTTVNKNIRFMNSYGTVIHTETTHHETTENYNHNLNETVRTITETVITFYDENRNLLQREIIREEPGTEAYWQEINKVISKYTIPITMRVTTTKVLVYYSNGVEMRRENVPTGDTNQPFTTQSDSVTTVVCHANDGQELYRTTLSGNAQTPAYNDLINSLRNQYSFPISVNTNITTTIKYFGSDHRLIYTGYVYESRTQQYNQQSGETSRISTVTIVKIFSQSGHLLEQVTIMDAPDSPIYWEQINNVVVKHHEVITIQTDTKKVITYYVNGKEIRSEQIPGPIAEPIHPELQRSTVITCYGPAGNILTQRTIAEDRTSPAYLNYLSALKQQHPDYGSIHTNTTITIYYRNARGGTVHVGSILQQHTDYRTPSRPDTTQTQTTTITTVTFYDPSGNLLHQETIRDEPGSTAYWHSIKNTITRYPLIALKIHTTITKVITYYSGNREIRQETVPGNAGIYEAPFTSHTDVVNVITFYGPNREVLNQQTVRGELTPADRKNYLDSFSRTHFGGTFTMETNTTKTLTYRSTDGRVLFTDNIFVPVDQGPSHTEIKTTFTVYGPDRRTILDQHTINGGTGSAAYNDYISGIIARFPGSITIYTNSTKTVTLMSDSGQPHQQVLTEPRSTIQREGDTTSSRARTSITFYAPDGTQLHQDTIEGAPGNELLQKLNQVANTFGGVLKSSVTHHNEGSVTHVDTPYPGHTFGGNTQHFTDFNVNRYNNYSSPYNNQTFRSPPLESLQDLGTYAKRRGYVNAGVDLGRGHSGNVDNSFDNQARRRFESYRTSETNPNYNYLRGQNIRHSRTKREEDPTTIDIKRLSECKTSNCSIIRCTTGALHNGNEVHIALRARVNVHTLTQLSTTQTVKIQSMLLARISQFEEILGVPEKRKLYRHQAITTVMPPTPDIKPDMVPLWVVILSAVAGTLILLLLIFLLYKCGFFNRSRPSDAPERQPLNRNGHFQHGDEAL
ncbi:uncharacterized protein LOC116175429 [Photinus pyralis]|uniref:uncharacterized protein LOC116175429 n=1 Tax=Photinus pyralis TaxID=7054 RepID=UPI001266F236|nr:uncharacterized protein LOC116175429 [Photinus pyralis]